MGPCVVEGVVLVVGDGDCVVDFAVVVVVVCISVVAVVGFCDVEELPAVVVGDGDCDVVGFGVNVVPPQELPMHKEPSYEIPNF